MHGIQGQRKQFLGGQAKINGMLVCREILILIIFMTMTSSQSAAREHCSSRFTGTLSLSASVLQDREGEMANK